MPSPLPTQTRPQNLLRRSLSALAIVVAMGGSGVLVASGQPSPREAIPSVLDARRYLHEAELARQEAERRLVLLDTDRVTLDSEIATLSAEDRQLLVDLESARRAARHLAVNAYVNGLGLSDLNYLLGVEGAADLAWRQELIESEQLVRHDAALHLEDLESRVSDEVEARVRALDANSREREQVLSDIGATETMVELAEELLRVAEAWELSDLAVERGRYGEASPGDWEQLRFCESSGNYEAVNDTGFYRGAYQFDRQTWRDVGGTGDPAAAPALEQDARARALYALRGSEPWPRCGSYLPD